MRTLALPVLAFLLLLGLAVAAVQARAEGEGDELRARIVKLEEQVKSLRADTELLYSREAAVTKYLLSLGQTADAVRQGVGQARGQGFEMAAIPPSSRAAVLSTLENLAKGLLAGLPAPSRAEQEMARRAEELHKAFPK